MIGVLYRYPHPQKPLEFIYCGQGANRDNLHRIGKTSFGRRFKKLFPLIELTTPIKERVDVSNQQELNEEETIWIFRYHTWCGYPDGMNLTLPGSHDYISLGFVTGRMNALNGHVDRIRSKESCSKGGKIGGRRRIELHGTPNTPEGNRKGGKIAGKINGKKAVDSGQLASIRTPENWAKAGRANRESGHMGRLGVSKIGPCYRWNILRGKSCTCGLHEEKI